MRVVETPHPARARAVPFPAFSHQLPLMKVLSRPLFFSVLGGALIGGCGGSATGGAASSRFRIEEVSNGFGRLLPYQIAQRDDEGKPTSKVIEITSLKDLTNNVTQANPIRPPTEWPIDAGGAGKPVLPSNDPGNHFIYVRFSQDIDIDSVLTPLTSAVDTNNMTTAIQVTAYKASNQSTTPLTGRAFVGGKTYGPVLERNELNQLTGRFSL